jgi:hypothetical protein
MFERYTEKARRVVFFARYEASSYGSPYIQPEHLLLGLLREDKFLKRWLPKTDYLTLRRNIDETLPKLPSISTAVDLPLSGESKHLLKCALDEADRLANKYIGTEHLFLGLLEEKGCLASKLLSDGGADANALRQHYAQQVEQPQPQSFPRRSYYDQRFRVLSDETIEIHGSRWNIDYVHDVVGLCRSYNWHWQKSAWKPRNIVVNRKSGKFSFDLALAEDETNFELVKLGWKKGHCFICRWELLESSGEHGTGYTNGHDWLCIECCERFLQSTDFFSSSQSEMT